MKYLVLFLLFTGTLIGQKKFVWDTTKYQKFKSNLIVGIFQSYRNFNNQFQPPKSVDTTGASKNNYYAESNLVTGIEVTYDKFSLAIGLKSTPQKNHSGKGNTNYFNLNFNVGGNIWRLENSMRYFNGFYDLNTPRYDSTFKETGNYYYQPNFTNTLVRSKFMYFTNHKKFSICSGSSCNYRQLRSSFTWIFSGNINYNYMRNDSSFFPLASRHYYGNHGDMNGLKVLGFALNAGAAGTLVLWKAFFVQVMFIVGPDHQWRRYHYLDGSSRLTYFSVSGDLRGSIGLNFKKFYFVSFSSNDFAVYNSSFMELTNKALSGGFILGWRFNSRTPEFYKRLQKTKFYLSL
jgi:hypothetical protein